MNYLSHVKTLSDNSLIKEQILEFEAKSGIKLPPIFKAFVQNYDLAFFSEAVFNRFYSPEFNDYYYFEKSTYTPNPEIVFYDFIKPSNYIKAKENIYHYEEDVEIISDKICIAEIAGGLLLLGYGESNLDYIYSDFIANDDRLHKVANNIFDFLRNIELKVDEDELQRKKIDTNRLFKKWGEDFWRF